MELSPWTVYWIMQLDSIVVTLIGLSILGVGVGIVGWLIYSVAWAEQFERKGPYKPPRFLVLFASLGLILATVTAFIPSTKSMATIIVLPAIVNNEHVQFEAGEIYALAKDALRELAGEKGPSDGSK